MEKRCSGCKKLLDTSLFGRDASRNDGLTHNCRICRNAYSNKYTADNLEAIRKTKRESAKRRYPANAEKISIRHKRYYQKHQDSLVVRAAAYRQAHPEYAKQYRHNNADKIRAYRKRTQAVRSASMREWRHNNSHVRKVLHIKRRTRKRELPCTFTPKDYEFMMAYWGGCVISGKNEDIHLDHWIPLSDPNCPGTTPDNMIPLIGALNVSKGGKMPDVWLREMYDEDKAGEIMHRVKQYFELVRQHNG